MIPFSFAYYRPETLPEAVETFTKVLSQGKTPVYYGGGSETITLCRAGSIQPDAVIDLKGIPDCAGLAMDDFGLSIGANCTLNQVSQSGLFPLLGLACGRIADHTNQCRITLGGNLCGTIQYRETSLPLLLAEAKLVLYGPGGQRSLPMAQVFDGRMRLEPGELIVQVRAASWALTARHFHVKKTTQEKIDYPLVSIAALYQGDQLRIGFSGVCSFPFRSLEMEALLGDRSKTREERARQAVALLPEPASSTVEGTGEYRAFVLENTLLELLQEAEHDRV